MISTTKPGVKVLAKPVEIQTLDLADMDFAWHLAIATYRHDGDPAEVARLVLAGVTTTSTARQFLADVVTGKEKLTKHGKGRLKITIAHREQLRLTAQFLHLQRALNRQQPDPNFQKLTAEVRDEAIAALSKKSGASIGSVREAWKKANTRWVALDRRNAVSQRRAEAIQREQLEREQRQALAARSNPFSG